MAGYPEEIARLKVAVLLALAEKCGWRVSPTDAIRAICQVGLTEAARKFAGGTTNPLTWLLRRGRQLFRRFGS